MDQIKIDGLDSLKKMFSTQEALIEYILKHTLFFDKKVVCNQARELRFKIRTGEAIPVRYNSNGAFFLQHALKTTTPNFKSKKEAVSFTNNDMNNLFHRETKIRICFDRDGNYYPKRSILSYTGHKVSCGEQSTVVNYVIAHIWGKTDNPLYFSLLWNYCLIPNQCAYLTDKREDSDPFIKRIKELIKAISIELYNPNHIMDWNQNVISETDMPSKETRSEARKLIVDRKINFLYSNTNTENE
ncbi:MAG: hypothetical protein RSA53_06330 [Odoribacter sp.]